MSSLEAALRTFRYHPEEEVVGLIELPQSPLEPEAAPSREELQLLAFSLGGEEYAVPLATVTEILRARRLTEIPRARPPLLGILNLRGTITPVYDPCVRLQRPTLPTPRAGPDAAPVPRPVRILVLRTLLGPAGLWVDRVRGVQRIRPEQMERPADGPTGGVLGVVRHAGGARTVVDPEWLLR
jgi:chemotaxis signal transduction protein